MAAPGPWTFTNLTRTDLLNGVDPLASGSFKAALLQSTSNIGAASTTFAGVTNEVAAGNGYASGGIAVAFTLSGTTSVTASFTTPPIWTASGAGIVARLACIYRVAGDVLAYALLDSAPADITVTPGNTFTLNAAPLLTLA